ncbi:MAG: hypothetical protein AAF518_20490 [Spirochaetota bacterium]
MDIESLLLNYFKNMVISDLNEAVKPKRVTKPATQTHTDLKGKTIIDLIEFQTPKRKLFVHKDDIEFIRIRKDKKATLYLKSKKKCTILKVPKEAKEFVRRAK